MNPKILTALGAGLLATTLIAAPSPQDQKPSPVKQSAASTKKTASTAREPAMTSDMREAIAWERRKDAAAERWAKIEAGKVDRVATSKSKR